MSSLAIALTATAIAAAELAGQGTAGSGSRQENVQANQRQEETLPARVVRDVTTVFNGRNTLRIQGDAIIRSDSTIRSDVAVLNGQLTISGQIRGRVVAINSDVILEPEARVDEGILVVGGLVGGRENGRIRGDIRVYRARMLFTTDADTIIPDPIYSDEGKWWSRFDLDGPRSRSKITVRGSTYNRVEGLPILVGPSFRHTSADFRTSVDALGILRTADRARWDSDNIGHRLDASIRLNRETGVGLGASLYDVVEPVETWQFSDHEVGLATFLLHRDYRDYYATHGGALHFSVFRGYETELRLTYAHERWSSRDVRDTWTIFDDEDPWRPNPATHDGRMHKVVAALRIDTRNSETNPWSGWFANAELERGQGELAPPDDRAAFADSRYSRAQLDLRRYNRISPRGQLNLRLVYGARLGDDELPLQKRFSVGGPGSLPGFDFRRVHGGTDVGMCSEGSLLPGRPALCERMALMQVEYRGDIGFDLFGAEKRDDSDWREYGRHPEAQWVVFADAGRGWLLGEADGGSRYKSGTLVPPLGTFRSDVGAGLDFGSVGFFVAKAVSQSGIPANFFIRLQHRF